MIWSIYILTAAAAAEEEAGGADENNHTSLSQNLMQQYRVMGIDSRLEN